MPVLRLFGCRLLLCLATAVVSGAVLADDRLASWTNGELKQSILAFVDRSDRKGDTGYIPREERNAVFDLDGTLIVEIPYPIATIPVMAPVKTAVERDATLAKQPGVAAFIAGDEAGLGDEGITNALAIGFAGRTVEDAAANMHKQLSETIHPDFKRPLTELQYQPMRELIALLRQHGFKIWICSGSPVNITREISEPMFGIPRENVMGTSIETKVTEIDGKLQLTLTDRIEHINDSEFKVVTIYRTIGRRPAFVAGNVESGGDIAMMRFSKDRPGPSFQLLINPDDANRGLNYREADNFSLKAAERYGFHVANIKTAWKTIFATQRASPF